MKFTIDNHLSPQRSKFSSSCNVWTALLTRFFRALQAEARPNGVKKSYTFCILLLIVCLTSCEKLIDVDPPIQTIVGQEIYNSNDGAASVLTGVYIALSEAGSFVHGINSLSVKLGLSGDELTLFNGSINSDLINFYQNSGESTLGNGYWASLYEFNFKVNAAIEGIQGSASISDKVRSQLLGEAKFLRAFFYFYLTNLYGDVPLVLSTDSKSSRIAPRIEQSLVYEQIVRDLEEAKKLLNENYVAADVVSTSIERVRPNKYTAAALLARVYLNTGQWSEAVEEASLVITNSMYTLTPLEQTFLMNSAETIWALQSRSAFWNNGDGLVFNFIDTDNGPSEGRPLYLSDQLYSTFEDDDNRKKEWIKTKTWLTETYPYANKYKTDATSTTITEYQMVFRLAELYLIRGEARARQGKLDGPDGAVADINMIRNRAGLKNITATNQSGLLNIILKERKNELFTEWGHRWFDLKRMNKIDEVMNSVSASKGATWQSFKALFPIPVSDLSVNPNLRGHQNPGYPEQ